MKRHFFLLLIVSISVFLLTGCEAFIFNTTTNSTQKTYNTIDFNKMTTGGPSQGTTTGNNNNNTTSGGGVVITTTGGGTVIVTTTQSTPITTTKNNPNPVGYESTGSQYVDNYYQTFDFSKINTYDSRDLILYMKDFLRGTVNYSVSSYDKLRYLYQYLDNVSDNINSSTKITMFYARTQETSEWNQANIWNREHVVPQSTWGGGTGVAPGYDMYNVRPSYTDVNGKRGNLKFGTVNHNTATALMKNGKVVGWYTSSTFEPLDEVKGDAARICFYMAVMFANEYNCSLSNFVSDKTFKTILEWNDLDPVSAEEIRRCDVVSKYITINDSTKRNQMQGNRNIFVDFPQFASVIWG